MTTELIIEWQSDSIRHRERALIKRERLGELASLRPLLDADAALLQLRAGELVPAYQQERVTTLPIERFPSQYQGFTVSPTVGRFYPLALLPELAERFDARMMRITANDGAQLTLDMNHPLALYPLQLRLGPLADSSLQAHSGLTISHIVNQGPGMQWPPQQLDIPEAYQRDDEGQDQRFYQQPRLVPHLDVTASFHLSQFYDARLPHGARVLDLMSSWQSHLPKTRGDLTITGLGMNREELDTNPQLAERIVHDLNQTASLPFDDAAFDAVICSASIEYLAQPVTLLKEVFRCLRPGGRIAITFSDRFFPDKAIALWKQMHPFERMGWVINWLQRAGFSQIETETIRFYPRPVSDRYHRQLPFSDPVFALGAVRPE